MLPTKFRFTWPSGFRGEEVEGEENQQYLYRNNSILNTDIYLIKSYLSFNRDFLEINQSETRIACGGHVC